MIDAPAMLVLPSRDRAYLERTALPFEEIREGGQAAVILRDVCLPTDKYDIAKTDVLFLLPPGYPDVPIDMFYLDPWARLKQSGACPRAADTTQRFIDRDWQRWSRHNPEWQPGKDGIWTMIARMKLALGAATQ